MKIPMNFFSKDFREYSWVGFLAEGQDFLQVPSQWLTRDIRDYCIQYFVLDVGLDAKLPFFPDCLLSAVLFMKFCRFGKYYFIYPSTIRSEIWPISFYSRFCSSWNSLPLHEVSTINDEWNCSRNPRYSLKPSAYFSESAFNFFWRSKMPSECSQFGLRSSWSQGNSHEAYKGQP